MIDFQTTQPLEHALDVAMARHDMLAGNLANLQVPGAARQDLDFEAALQDASRPASDFKTEQGSPTLGKETAALAETDLFYASAAKLLSLRFTGLKAAMK